MNSLLQNRYRIINNLGAGGFGETFLAEDTHLPSQRRCVIKQLKPVNNNPQVYQLIQDRFKREAVILEKLGEGNPHIPTLYAYFEENGQFYLVQEWIDGVTLTDKVKEGILPETTVKNILIQSVATLITVHNQGIIHRDIKPDNIMLRNSDNQPVLIDFGAVKETMGTMMTPSGHEASSIVIGTPGFMPSEQSIGRPVFSSDLYSLALTAIYLLTGKTPPQMEADLTTGITLWQQYAPHINPQLAAILDKAISPHPKDRFLTAAEMLNALQSLDNSFSPTFPLQTTNSTVVISPSQVNNSALRDWQKAVIIGSIMGVFLLLAVVLAAIVFNTPQPETITTQSPTPEHDSSQDIISESEIPTPEDESPPEIIPEPETPTLDHDSSQDIISEPEIPTPEDESPPEIIPEPETPTPEYQPTPQLYLDKSTAIATIENLYSLLSNQQYNQALNLFSDNLARQFDPNFFSQFQRVTVENLRVVSQTDSVIKFMGENTYVYLDGSTQREVRSYTVENYDGQPKITASEFIKVIKFR